MASRMTRLTERDGGGEIAKSSQVLCLLRVARLDTIRLPVRYSLTNIDQNTEG